MMVDEDGNQYSNSLVGVGANLLLYIPTLAQSVYKSNSKADVSNCVPYVTPSH